MVGTRENRVTRQANTGERLRQNSLVNFTCERAQNKQRVKRTIIYSTLFISCEKRSFFDYLSAYKTNAFTRLGDILLANGYIRNNLERENFEIAGIGRDGLEIHRTRTFPREKKERRTRRLQRTTRKEDRNWRNAINLLKDQPVAVTRYIYFDSSRFTCPLATRHREAK